MIGLSYAENDNEEVIASSHWEGTATGFGAVFGTLEIVLVFSAATSAAPIKLRVGPANTCLAPRKPVAWGFV